MDAQSSSSTGNAVAPVSVPKLSAFWFALLVGVALRVYCIVFTSGTGDLEDWQDHAQQVLDRGLIGYYHANSFANHPPLISEVASVILQTSTATHIPFRIL